MALQPTSGAGSEAIATPIVSRDCRFELPARGASVGEARQRAAGYLQSLGASDEKCHTAALMISELATNVVCHTDSPDIAFALHVDGKRVHLQVADQGLASGRPTMHVAPVDGIHGRGLQLVAALADSWGVFTGPTGVGRMVAASFLWV